MFHSIHRCFQYKRWLFRTKWLRSLTETGAAKHTAFVSNLKLTNDNINFLKMIVTLEIRVKIHIFSKTNQLIVTFTNIGQHSSVCIWGGWQQQPFVCKTPILNHDQRSEMLETSISFVCKLYLPFCPADESSHTKSNASREDNFKHRAEDVGRNSVPRGVPHLH